MICGTNLTYDPKKHYRHVASAVIDYYRSVEDPAKRLNDLKTFLRVFKDEDAKAILDWIQNNDGKLFPRDFGVSSTKADLRNPWYLESRVTKSVLEYFADYGGNPISDTEDLQTNMNTELVKELVYNPETFEYFQPNSESDELGYTVLNWKLRNKRLSIAKELIDLLDIKRLKDLDFNINNDSEYTSFINQAIIYAQSELEKRRILNKQISPKVRKLFIQLNCFDELLKNSGFIQLEDESNIFTKSRYTFTGETIDIKGSQFKEHADSEEYTSKLVKVILNSLKTKVSNETLGLKGFQTAISYAMEWALSGKNKAAFDAVTDPNGVNINKAISLFVTRSHAPKKVKQALITINEYLFGEKVPNAIKEIFVAQALTTVKSTYFEYSLGTFKRKQVETKKVTITPGVTIKKAEDKVLDESKWEVVRTIISKINFYLDSGNKEARQKFLSDFKISKDGPILTFSPWPGMTITIKKLDDGTFEWTGPLGVDFSDQTYNFKWKSVLQKVLDLPLSDMDKCRDILSETGNVSKGADGKLNYHLINPFKQMLSIVLWTVRDERTLSDIKTQDKYLYGKLFKYADAAGVFLNEMFNNEFTTVTKDLNGNNIPPHQMGSLGYRTKQIISGILKNPDHVKFDNFFVKNIKALGQTILREGIEMGGIIKNSADLSANEVLQLQIITDFYNALMYPQQDETGVSTTSIFLQPMVYSDKTRHIIKEIVLDTLKFSDGTDLLPQLKAIVRFGNARINAEKKFIKEINNLRGKEARKTLVSKLQRFASAFNISVPNGVLTDDQIQKLLIAVNTKLSAYSLDDVRKLFKRKGITFYEENDVNKKGIGLEINPLLVHHFNTFALNNSEDYFNFVKAQFAFDLLEDRFRMDMFLDPSLQTFIKDAPKEWVNSNSGNLLLFKIKDKSGKEVVANSAEEVKEKGYVVELNPILNGFFWAHNLFGQQIRTLQMGADYSIKGSGGDPYSDTDVRFIAQSKRAMGQGSTVMKFDTTRKYGVSNIAETAVFDDPAAQVFNPKGHSKKDDYDSELVADGAGYISPIQFVLEQWSLPGNVKLRNDVVKSILQSIDAEGNLRQIKWAGTTVSNLRRRGAPASEGINLDRMFKLMHSKPLNKDFDISKFYGDFVFMDGEHSITCTKKLYFYDINTGKHWRIDSVERDGIGKVKRTITEVNDSGDVIGGTFANTYDINTLYDIHELFGGKWCKIKRNGELKYSEINNEILANIVCSERLKNRFVHYTVNKSAYKVGVSNVNSVEVFHRKSTSDLWTDKIELQFSGIQLDAGHEVKDGEVTEMSQLVSLLIEKGFCTDIVDDIYKNIATVTKAGLDKFSNPDKIKTIISEILVESFNSSSSNVTSITDDFIKQLINKVKTEGIDLEVPFSSPTIKGKFATAICASINSLALRRRYPGLGTVQTPSFDEMQTHNIGGFFYTYEQIVDKYREDLNSNGYATIDWLFDDLNAPEGFITENYLSRMQNVMSTTGHPVIEKVSQEELDFEDTVIYRDSEGKLHYEKIGYIGDYYKFRYGNYPEIYRWNTKGRNLVQQLMQFQVVSLNGNSKFNIYDLDISRAIQYLSTRKHWKNSPDRQSIEDFLFEYTGRRGSELDAFFGTVNHQTLVKNLQNELQELLREFKPGVSVKINGVFRTVVNTWNKPADIMMGNPWAKQYHWKDSDSISDVLEKKEGWFLKRLEETYSPISPREVPRKGYDAILYEEDGTPILIQFGSEENYGRLHPDKLSPSASFSKATGKLRYKGEDLGDINGVAEFTYTSTSNKQYKVLRLKDHTRINALMKSKLFSEVIYNVSQSTLSFDKLCDICFKNKVVNGKAIRDFYIGTLKINKGTDLNKMFQNKKYQENLIEEFNSVQQDRLVRKFKNLSTKQYLAFKKLLNVVGTRIPSQSLQSCAACRIVAFTGSETNDVYLPRILTWTAGSDYDIDKFFIMMNGILENGTLSNLSGITNPNYDGVSVNDLPPSPGVEFDAIVSTKRSIDEYGNEVNVFESGEISVSIKDIRDVLTNENGRGIEVLSRILNEYQNKQNPTITVFVNQRDVNETPESELLTNIIGSAYEVEELVSNELVEQIYDFIDLLNEYSTNDKSKYTKRYKEVAEKNSVMNSIFKALTSPAVQLGLQNPVSMELAKTSVNKRTTEKSHLNADNPRSIAKQQQDNMVGKIGIASVAVAQKAFNGISYSFNIMAKNLAKGFNTFVFNEALRQNEVPSAEWLRQLTTILIPTKDGKLMTIANIDFRDLVKSTEKNPFLDWGVVPVEWAKIFENIGVKEVFVQPDGSIRELINVNKLAIYLKDTADKTDAIDLFSNIMSCATDNAKELLLAKLNAVGENLDLYTYLFAIGYDFDQAADLIMSDTFKIVSKYKDTNIFIPDSYRTRQQNTIDFILDQDHLPIVNSTILNSILTSIDNDINGLNEIDKSKSLFSYLIKVNKSSFIRFNELLNQKKGFTLSTELELLHYLGENKNEFKDIVKSFLLSEFYYPEVQKIILSDDGWLAYWIKSRSKSQGYFEEQEIDIDFFDDYWDDSEFDMSVVNHGSTYDFREASGEDLSRIYKYLEFYLFPKNNDIIALRSKNPGLDIRMEYEKLMNMTKGANELATLGRKILSINQGMHVGDYEEWNWIDRINVDVNRKFSELDKFEPFDMVRFMTDNVKDKQGKTYSERMINQYEYVKENVNILDIFIKSPHFYAMVESAITARQLLEKSIALKTARDIGTKLKFGVRNNDSWNVVETWQSEGNPIFNSITRSLSEQEWRAISNLINEQIIFNFFSHLPDELVTFHINSDQITSAYTTKINLGKKTIVKTENVSKSFKLNTIDGIATFLKWMDIYYIPKLKEKLQISDKGYVFADMLVQVEEDNSIYGTTKRHWNINKNIRTAKPGEALYEKRSEVINDFAQIMRDDSELEGFKIGDLFYIYNLLNYKDGSSGMTFLFADAAASGNTSDWVDAFQTYVSDLDHGKITADGEFFEIKPSDVLFAIVNQNNAWKFNVTFTPNQDTVIKSAKRNGADVGTVSIGKPEFLSNSYFPFTIPSLYDDITDSHWQGFKPFNKSKVHISGQEVLHEVIARLNPMLQASGIKIVEVQDSDLDTWSKNGELMFANISEFDANNIKESRGFVYDGNIYINISEKESSSLGSSEGLVETLMHECVHLICANLHYNPEYRNKYLTTIKNLWDSASDETKQLYRERYKNKRATDLMEEYFAEQIAHAFYTNFSEEFAKIWEKSETSTPFHPAISVGQLKHDVAESLKNVFGLMKIPDNIDFSKLGGTDVVDLLNLFGSILFDFNKVGFTTTNTTLSQELATVKNTLINKNKIIEKC